MTKSTNKPLVVLLLLATFILGLLLVVKPTIPSLSKSTKIKNVSMTVNTLKGETLLEKKSPSGNYTYIIQGVTPDDAIGNCAISVKSNTGKATVLSTKANPSGEVDCNEVNQGGAGPFVGWSNTDDLILSQGNNAILYNPRTHDSEIIQHDENYSFVTADSTANVFLYQSKQGNSDELVVSGKQFSTENKLNFAQDIEDGYDIYDRLFDSTNNGFVITLRKNGIVDKRGSVFVKIYFYNIITKKLSTVLNSGDTSIGDAFPFSCNITEVVSKKAGEILLNSSCLIVEKKYLDKEGNIKIKL